MIIQVKTGPAERLSLDELITANAFLTMLQERIKENGHEVPGDVAGEAREVERQLESKLEADRERRIKVLEMRRDGLLSRGDKLKQVENELNTLKGKPAQEAVASK